MSDIITDLEFWSTDPIVMADVRDLLKTAASEIEHLLMRIDELEKSFDMRWDADMRAIKRWQEETGKQKTWPDHADLVVWLLKQLKEDAA